MTVWRPRPAIQTKAIGLAWSEGRLLAAEIRDDAGRLKGVRPLGGAVEFGERWQDALVREFEEELGLRAEVAGEPIVLENIFTHEGMPGHEIVFAADVGLPADSIQGRDVVAFAEGDGTPCVARWFDIDTLDAPTGPALYPDGLGRRLAARRGADPHRPAVTGLNHVTLAVRHLDRALAFYEGVLGMTRRAIWPEGAYLDAGDLWLCLSVDPDARTEPHPDYTHIALSVEAAAFPALVRRTEAAARSWRENRSEGASLYVLDPDGHKLELHVGSLASRLDHYRANPAPGRTIFDDHGPERPPSAASRDAQAK